MHNWLIFRIYGLTSDVAERKYPVKLYSHPNLHGTTENAGASVRSAQEPFSSRNYDQINEIMYFLLSIHYTPYIFLPDVVLTALAPLPALVRWHGRLDRLTGS